MNVMRVIVASITWVITSLICGCAQTEHQIASDEVLTALSDYLDVQKELDLNKTLAHFSAEFVNSRGATKVSLRGYLENQINMGVFQKMTVNLEELEISFDGTQAIATPVIYTSAIGKAEFSYKWIKEPDGVWRIINSEQTLPEHEWRNRQGKTNHFKFVVIGEIPDEVMLKVSQSLLQNRERILRVFRLTELPTVTVKIWEDRQAFETWNGGNLSDATGYINARLWEVHALLRGTGTDRTAVHEFAHLAATGVNPSIVYNPRWFWEVVALYANNEKYDPAELSCISPTEVPSIEELNSHHTLGNTKIYQVGYLLAEYIIENWGHEVFIQMIKENADLIKVLNLTPIEFQHSWHQFVLSRYDIQIPMNMSNQEVMAEMSGNTFYWENVGSSYLARDGRLFDGFKGKVKQEGTWSVKENGELCARIVSIREKPFCNIWQLVEADIFRFSSDTNCLWQTRRRVLGNSESYSPRR